MPNSPMYGEHKKSTKNTALIGGKVVTYNMCSEYRSAYSDYPDNYYIGKGCIYEINGKRQKGFDDHYFFNRGKNPNVEDLPKVKRYDLEESYSPFYRKDTSFMNEVKDGSYVKFEDYEALQKELEEIRRDQINI
jgi:hypothetical protein